MVRDRVRISLIESSVHRYLFTHSNFLTVLNEKIASIMLITFANSYISFHEIVFRVIGSYDITRPPSRVVDWCITLNTCLTALNNRSGFKSSVGHIVQ